jgi:hypothetical protein
MVGVSTNPQRAGNLEPLTTPSFEIRFTAGESPGVGLTCWRGELEKRVVSDQRLISPTNPGFRGENRLGNQTGKTDREISWGENLGRGRKWW